MLVHNERGWTCLTTKDRPVSFHSNKLCTCYDLYHDRPLLKKTIRNAEAIYNNNEVQYICPFRRTTLPRWSSLTHLLTLAPEMAKSMPLFLREEFCTIRNGLGKRGDGASRCLREVRRSQHAHSHPPRPFTNGVA